MMCSLLECLFYNVTCIVLVSNNILDCCSEVTDSSWFITKWCVESYKHCLHAQRNQEKYTTPVHLHIAFKQRQIHKDKHLLPWLLLRWSCDLLQSGVQRDTWRTPGNWVLSLSQLGSTLCCSMLHGLALVYTLRFKHHIQMLFMIRSLQHALSTWSSSKLHDPCLFLH